jgi:acyl-[acyl-carrier-protein]-phospholipid O-acyltransferase/long-chain-fatty-acid--[acyl-carrier-protein] ligase
MIARRILRRVLALLYRIQIDSNADGGAHRVFVANHPSKLDAIILSFFLSSAPTAIVSHLEMKPRWLRVLFKLISHAVIDVREPRSLRALHKLSESGANLLLFPEGLAERSVALRKIYDVPAVFAAQRGFVPVHIERIRRRFRIRVSPPIAVHSGTRGSAKERRKSAVSQLQRAMEASIASSGAAPTIFEALLDAVSVHGRRRKILEDVREQPQSYGQLVKTSLALGRWISRFSARGEAVGVLLPNLTATVCTVLGVQASGRVPAMLNHTSGAAGIKNACIAANVKSIVSTRKFLAHIKASSLPDLLPQYNWVFLENVALSIVDKLWLIAYALWFPRRAMVREDTDAAAVILFTSGSEDRPKGVALSHKAVLSNIGQMRALVDFKPHDKFFNPLPMYHSYSFTACTLMPLISGTSLFLYPTPLHYRAIPEVAYRKRCTCMFGTGTFLAKYAEHAKPYDFAHVRFVVAGGEKLREEVQSLWTNKFGLRILEGYGATECAPVIALNSPNRFRKNTVGNLLPGIEYRLSPVPGISSGGLLHVRGPNVMLGYYRFEEPGVLQPTCSDFGTGWYCTGDIVNTDPDGLVTIQGRAKRFAKIAGEMVSLEVVETIATRASPSAEHAAVAHPDDERGEAVVLFTTDARLERIALNRTAHEAGWPTLALPRRIVHVKALPLLGTGKTDYVGLAAMLAEMPAPPVIQRAL